MTAKPGDFAAGFTDVVGVLFPGAALAFLLEPQASRAALSLGLPALTDSTARWVAFTVAAYFLGHLVFLLGAFLDWAYDPLRERMRPRAEDVLYQKALAVRDAALKDAAEALNAYKYSKAFLAMRFPNAVAEVERTEAESKFFRSVVALLVMALFLYWGQLTGPGRAVGLLLIVLSFSRYSERRWKSNQLAFAFLVVDAATPQVRRVAD